MHYTQTIHAYSIAFETGLQVAALIQLLADEDGVLVERQDLLDILQKFGRKPPKPKSCDMLLWRTRKALDPYSIEVLSVRSAKGRGLYISDENKRKVKKVMNGLMPVDWSSGDETHTIAA